MKKSIWYLLLILGSLYMAGSTLAEIFIYKRITLSRTEGIIFLASNILFSALLTKFLFIPMREKGWQINGWVIGLPILIVVLVAKISDALQTEVPLYFIKLSLGLSLLFYVAWLLTKDRQKTIS